MKHPLDLKRTLSDYIRQAFSPLAPLLESPPSPLKLPQNSQTFASITRSSIVKNRSPLLLKLLLRDEPLILKCLNFLHPFNNTFPSPSLHRVHSRDCRTSSPTSVLPDPYPITSLQSFQASLRIAPLFS